MGLGGDCGLRFCALNSWAHLLLVYSTKAFSDTADICDFRLSLKIPAATLADVKVQFKEMEAADLGSCCTNKWLWDFNDLINVLINYHNWHLGHFIFFLLAG